MKNLAGNEVSIFLFQFKLRTNGIEFILNEGIAADMYPDLDAIPVNEILKLRQTFTRRGLQTFSEMPDSRYYPTLQRFLFFNRRSGLGFTVSGNS